MSCKVPENFMITTLLNEFVTCQTYKYTCQMYHDITTACSVVEFSGWWCRLGGGTALLGQLYQNTALLELLSESKMLFSASLAESLGHRRVKCPLFCLYNIKGAGALISIKRTIGLNYLYDCPLELPSMPFSLSAFSKPLSPQEVYVRGIQCRQFRRHKRALH